MGQYATLNKIALESRIMDINLKKLSEDQLQRLIKDIIKY